MLSDWVTELSKSNPGPSITLQSGNTHLQHQECWNWATFSVLTSCRAREQRAIHSTSWSPWKPHREELGRQRRKKAILGRKDRLHEGTEMGEVSGTWGWQGCRDQCVSSIAPQGAHHRPIADEGLHRISRWMNKFERQSWKDVIGTLNAKTASCLLFGGGQLGSRQKRIDN